MARRKRMSQAKTLDEAQATTVQPYAKDVQRFEDYYAKARPINTYAECREYLNWLLFGQAHGMVATRVANTSVYIISHILMTIKAQGSNTEALEELTELLEQRDGNLQFTEEQMTLIGQQSSMNLQAQLICKFAKENGVKIPSSDRSLEHLQAVDVESVKLITEAKIIEEDGGFV